jgi:hypothetical protein
MKPIRVYLAGAREWRPEAEYAMRALLEGIGVPWVEAGSATEADLAYSGARPAGLPAGALWIPATSEPDWNRPSPEIRWSGELPFFGPPPENPASGESVPGDAVYSAYALLTGSLEAGLPRDAWGVPVVLQSLAAAAGMLEIPVIERYESALLGRLRASGRVAEVVQRWPDGARGAVVLSHDVDSPWSNIDTSYRWKRLRLLVRRGRPPEAARAAGSLARTALLDAAGRFPRPAEDPNLGFDAWIRFERELGTGSAFYVAVVTSADPEGHPKDVTYDYRHPVLLQEMRRAAEAGWEIGLHLSINAWPSLERIRAEKRRLEEALGGRAVTGLRHHFWAMDPERPERTLALHAEAGFGYDSSLGLNDAPGFRRGIARPYRPYDRVSRRELPILELPPTLMDGGIFYHDLSAEEGAERIRRHLRSVLSEGGAAVLDWHLEQMNPSRLRGAGPALCQVLREIAGDRSIFWASPERLASWWRGRRASLDAAARG